MIAHIDTLRATMTAFGFREERIDAALGVLTADSALAGQPEEPRYLSPKKLCLCLDISCTTIWRLNPPFHRIGGRKRYLLNEVMAYMDAIGKECKSIVSIASVSRPNSPSWPTRNRPSTRGNAL